MTVKELLKEFKENGVGLDTEVVLMGDEEGNRFADKIEVHFYKGVKNKAFLCPMNDLLPEDMFPDVYEK